MADLPIDPLTGGIAAVSTAVATAVASGVAAVRGKNALSDEDRKALTEAGQAIAGISGRLAAMEQSLTTITASVASHREEDAGLRQSLAETRAALGQLVTDARPLLEGWRREQERWSSIERKGDERKAIEEETARKVSALHERLDALTAQLREQLPPGLTEAIRMVEGAAHALRIAVEDRLPRRDR